MEEFLGHVLGVGSSLCTADVTHFHLPMIMVYRTERYDNGYIKKFPVLYLDKTNGDIYPPNGKNPQGNVHDEFGGLEYIDGRGNVLINRQRRKERLESLKFQ